MEYAVVIVPAAPVRRRARHQSEMISQLLFGEMAEVLKRKKKKWVKVRSLHDSYEGWITQNMLAATGDNPPGKTAEFVTTGMLNLVTIGEDKMQVPCGSSLPGFAGGHGMIGTRPYQFDGNYINRFEQSPRADLLMEYVFAWLNVPYMWGGRTPLGADCSGFVQVNYKLIGVDLPRDTWQQAQEGVAVNKLKDARAGDLVFFDDKDEIIHVGILLDSERVIHEFGKVRIDRIDKRGIINADSGSRTHSLKAIRRLW